VSYERERRHLCLELALATSVYSCEEDIGNDGHFIFILVHIVLET
jgi:hypothetical protein